MAEKRYYWLKLKEGFFRDKPMKKLRKVAGGDTYTIIYLKMLLLSLQDNGKLYFDEIEDNFVEEIALEIDEDEENVRFTIMFLEKCGLLTYEDDSTIYFNSIEDMIGSEAASTIRSRKCRENKKTLQCNDKALICNDDATNCNTEIDIDIEIDKEIDLDTEKEKNKKEKVVDKSTTKKKSPTYYPDNLLNQTFLEFIEMRKKIKKPMTDRAITLCMNKLETLATPQGDCHMDIDLAIKILDQSIFNSWQDIYPLKRDRQQNNNVFNEWRDA